MSEKPNMVSFVHAQCYCKWVSRVDTATMRTEYAIYIVHFLLLLRIRLPSTSSSFACSKHIWAKENSNNHTANSKRVRLCWVMNDKPSTDVFDVVQNICQCKGSKPIFWRFAYWPGEFAKRLRTPIVTYFRHRIWIENFWIAQQDDCVLGCNTSSAERIQNIERYSDVAFQLHHIVWSNIRSSPTTKYIPPCDNITWCKLREFSTATAATIWMLSEIFFFRNG